MRITAKRNLGQLFLLLFSVITFACSGRREEAPVPPPVTSPLSRDYIGFGVITSSFTHVNIDPSDDSQSSGYLRRGSLVRIVRRQAVRTSAGFQLWVLIDGDEYGWLKEEVMDIYSSESQAKTASESLLR